MFTKNSYKRVFKKKRVEDYTYVIAKEEPLTYVTENLQKTILNLEFANVDNKYKIIQVTSTVQSEGKTTILSNLAYLLAQRGKKVLVVDLDLRRPKLNRIASVAKGFGLTDYLLGESKLNDIISEDENLGIDYIVAGKKITAITNALMSDKLKNMLEELKESYDYILLDTPPTYVVSDAYYISKIVDGLIYVIAQNHARKKEVRESFNELKKIDADVIGVIMTQVAKGKSKNYYYYED